MSPLCCGNYVCLDQNTQFLEILLAFLYDSELLHRWIIIFRIISLNPNFKNKAMTKRALATLYDLGRACLIIIEL